MNAYERVEIEHGTHDHRAYARYSWRRIDATRAPELPERGRETGSRTSRRAPDASGVGAVAS